MEVAERRLKSNRWRLRGCFGRMQTALLSATEKHGVLKERPGPAGYTLSEEPWFVYLRTTSLRYKMCFLGPTGSLHCALPFYLWPAGRAQAAQMPTLWERVDMVWAGVRHTAHQPRAQPDQHVPTPTDP